MSEEIIESVEIVETEVSVEENEPVYYNPKMLTLIATFSRVLSWLVLVGFVLIVVGNYMNLQELTQGASFAEVLQQGAARTWLYSNLAIPILTGLGLFIIMQGISVGLDVLLEIEFNTRESEK